MKSVKQVRSFSPAVVSEQQPRSKKVASVLIVTDRLSVTADDPAAPFMSDFVHALKERGITPTIFAPYDHKVSVACNCPLYGFQMVDSEDIFSRHSLWSISGWKRLRHYLQLSRQALLDHLEARRYDQLLALRAFPSGWLAREASEATVIPYSIWILESDIGTWTKNPIAGRRVRLALRGATALFADGDELAEKVMSLSGRECHFLPAFRRFHFRIMPLPREKFFLYVGRLEKTKGIFDLLKAFARIKKDIWDYRLLVIGVGRHAEAVKRSVESLKLRGKVHLLGQVPTEELINYLQRARALVIPTHNDSIPLVFGEALQTGTPMVVTNVGDLGALVHDNKLGFVVQRKSPSSLADGMVRVIVSDLDIAESAQHLLPRLSPESAAATFLQVVSGDRS